MLKNFEVHGQKCSIKLIKNASYTTKKGTSAITHDDYETRIPVHECVGIIEGINQFSKKFEEWTPEGIRGVVMGMENSIKRKVEGIMMEHDRLQAVDLTLKELGFK